MPLSDRWRYFLEDWRDRANIGAIIVILLALGVGVGAIVTLTSDGKPADTTQLLPPDLPEQSSSPTPDASTSASPEPSASAVASPSVSPGAVSSPGPQPTTATKPTPKPAPPVTTGNGAKVTLAVQGSPKTGSQSTIRAHIVDPGGGLAAYVFSFDVDNPANPDFSEARTITTFGQTEYDQGEADAWGSPCLQGSKPSSSVDQTITFNHTFRVPGTYTALIAVQTRSCSSIGVSPYGVPQIGGQPVTVMSVRYTVGGTEWPNGLQEPTITTSSKGAPPFHVKDDGAITSIRVDSWGDGSGTQTLTFSPSSSSNGPCGHVDEWGPPDMEVIAQAAHTYDDDQTSHQVTITATSASCDGSGSQSSTVTFTYQS